MEESYQEIWKLVEPLLFKAKRKDFLIHTKMVEKAMREIIAGEGGDTTFLIPAAILHDVGWSEVSEKLQLAKDEERKNKALQEHIQKAPKIIRELLTKVNYDKDKIERIVDIVVAHKFTEPKEKEKQILIDADTLSDTYKESFYSDVKSYGSTPREIWEFRSKNTFYTKTAKEIFERELNDRQKEINNK